MNVSLLTSLLLIPAAGPMEFLDRMAGATWHTSLNLPDKYENLVTTYRKDRNGVVTGAGRGQAIGEPAIALKSQYSPTKDPKVMVFTDNQGETKLRGTVRRDGESLVITYGAVGKPETVREVLTLQNADRTILGEVYSKDKHVLSYVMKRVTPVAPELAIDGLDPVLFLKGQKVGGKPAFSQSVGEFKYHFASRENLAAFRANPARYSATMGGACLNMGPMSGRGQPNLYEVFEGKLCLFASESCRQAFLKSPTDFIVRPDSPIEAGNTVPAHDLLDRAARTHGVDTLNSILCVESSTYKSGARTLRLDQATWSNFKDTFANVQSWENATFVALMSPKSNWSGTLAEPSTFEPSEREYFARENGRDFLAILKNRKSKGLVVRGLGRVNEPGEGKWSAVQVHLKGATTTLFVDEATGRVGGIRHQGRLMRPDYQITKVFDDYKQIGGALVPFKVTSQVHNSAPRPVTFTKIEVNVPIDKMPVKHPLKG